MDIRKIKKSEINKFSEFSSFIISNVDYDKKEVALKEAEKYSIDSIKNGYSNKNNLYIVCEEKNKFIGFCSGYLYAGVFWADWMGVEKKFRRKNIGINLMKFLESEAKKLGAHKISLVTRINNNGSINMLKKMKYKKIANLKKHWYKEDFYMWEKFI